MDRNGRWVMQLLLCVQKQASASGAFHQPQKYHPENRKNSHKMMWQISF